MNTFGRRCICDLSRMTKSDVEHFPLILSQEVKVLNDSHTEAPLTAAAEGPLTHSQPASKDVH